MKANGHTYLTEPRCLQELQPGSVYQFNMRNELARAGPTLAATPILRDGQNSLVIPTESDQQFFRLAKP